MQHASYKGNVFPLAVLCREAGLSRQAYYQGQRRIEGRLERHQQAIDVVHQLRRALPRLGTRKLYHEGHDAFRALKLGRDRLFALLRSADLLIARKRRRGRTTDSRHGFGVYQNLLKPADGGQAVAITRAHAVFVCDLTYVHTRQGFCYAALVSDAFSRKIVGWDVSRSLSVEGSLRALDQALGQTTPQERRQLIHHSDRGVQYCCGAYQQRLLEAGVRVSMAAAGNPYENAQAERINGILKQEFGLDGVFADVRQARRAFAEAVRLYNEKRPHLALAYRKPEQVHAESRMAA